MELLVVLVALLAPELACAQQRLRVGRGDQGQVPHHQQVQGDVGVGLLADSNNYFSLLDKTFSFVQIECVTFYKLILSAATMKYCVAVTR